MDFEQLKLDPRLQQIQPEKLQYIMDFASRVSSLSKEQVMPAFLNLQMDAARKNIRFSDAETEILVSILSSGMTATEKKKLETLRILAKKLAARSS